jgi:microcystin-dependent protein
MSTPFLGQLMLVPWAFAAKGWALCNGQLLAINQNQALFSILGTTYGGDGRVNFALPNLPGRTPVGMGNGIPQGQSAGEASHTLTISEVPAHVHTVSAVSPATSGEPGGALLAGGGLAAFNSPTNMAAMNLGTLASFGGSQPHENRQPYLVLNWCIALQGIFPSQN